MPIKKKIFLITALIYILYLIFPLFSDTFNIPVWLPSMAAVAVMVVLYPQAFANKTFYWFLAYAVVLGIYVLVGKRLTIGIGKVADFKKVFIEFAYILPTIGIFSVLTHLNDKELTKKLVNWSLLMLFVSFIVVVPLLLRYQSLRDALHEQDEEFTIAGLPGYSLMHAYTLFVPLMCYIIKIMKGRGKWIALGGLLTICFVLYSTAVTTSLLLMVVTLLFSILYNKNNIALSWILIAGFLLISYILLQFGVLVTLIDVILPFFEDTAVEPKLLDFKASMLQGELTGGSITTRQNLHAISWNSFFQNPVFGTSVVGGHSSLIDRLGGMGLFAFIPFIMIIITFIKRMSKQYETRTSRTFFGVGVTIGVLFLYIKGNWGCEAWLIYMVLMPMGILSFESRTTNTLEK